MLKVYMPTTTLIRSDYRNLAEYRRVYRACCEHYAYKARVSGGWKFFEYITDYETWKKQK